MDAVTTWHIPPGSGLVPAADMPNYKDDARIILTEAITEMCTIDGRGQRHQHEPATPAQPGVGPAGPWSWLRAS